MAPYGTYSGPSYSGRNRKPTDGGPSGVSRSYASQLKEHDPLFTTYEHLSGLPRGDDALKLLRKIASVVKPLMRKRGWRVQILSEFLPSEQNLLGLNINRGHKICIRLRYHNDPGLFLPLEQVTDTLLHELAHIVWGEHDGRFHALWDELRDEHDVLVRKGFSGEGFLGEGRKLGGQFGGGGRQLGLGGGGLRGLAAVAAGKRKERGLLGLSGGGEGGGRKLGGRGLTVGRDAREVIAEQALARSTISKGCGSGRADAGVMAEAAGRGAFKTREEEDEANERAIARAVIEIEEEEEDGVLRKPPAGEGGLAWSRQQGLYDPKTEPSREKEKGDPMPGLTEEEQLRWAIEESRRSQMDISAEEEDSETDSDSPPEPPPVNLFHNPQQLRAQATPTTQPPRPAPCAPNNSAQPPTIDLTSDSDTSPDHPSKDPNLWTCEICTCINPTTYLMCDACGIERPSISSPKLPSKPRPNPASTTRPSGLLTEKGRLSRAAEVLRQAQEKEARDCERRERERRSMGWRCGGCGAFMEHQWWTCSACGVMKGSS